MGLVAGYEANGGFLLGFDATGPAGILARLPTRDCLLPIVAPLALSRQEARSLAGIVADLPARFTASDRLQDIGMDISLRLIDRLTHKADRRAAFFGRCETGLDTTDGLRLTFGDEVVHLRLSGNAPELRIYSEAADVDRSRALVLDAIDRFADEVQRPVALCGKGSMQSDGPLLSN